MVPWKRHESTARQQEEVEDGEINPLNGKKFSAKYKDILRTRRETLPVSHMRQEFLDRHQKEDIVLLSAATGSGKTV